MFTKLTRIDGSPVWLNSSFVVTIEPGRQGGSIVVPIGDGLDYEVRESPAEVLSLLGNAPMPDLIPVPIVNSLTRLPADVVPEGSLVPNAKQLAKESRVRTKEKKSASETKNAAKDAKGKKTTDEETSTVASSEPASGGAEETLSVPKPRGRKSASSAKKTSRTPRAKVVAKPILDLTEEQVERLRKMAPGSIKKLQNTLATQFRVPDSEATITALVAHDVVLTDEHGRVLWKPKPQQPDRVEEQL